MTTPNKLEMVDLFADLAVHEEAVEVPYHSGISFKIARAENEKFRSRLAHYYKSNKRLIDSQSKAGEAKAREIMMQAMAETVLVGWTGPMAYKGEPLPYSVENAKMLMETLPTFLGWVQEQAGDLSLFKVVQEDEIEKN